MVAHEYSTIPALRRKQAGRWLSGQSTCLWACGPELGARDDRVERMERMGPNNLSSNFHMCTMEDYTHMDTYMKR